MSTPTNENRDTARLAPEPKAEDGPRQRFDLSVTKIAAGASAAALAAAVGSKLGVAGTIVGAAVASVVSTSASTVIGHSLERGKTAARKAMPVLDPEQVETALLSRARIARAERSVRAANGAERVPMAEASMAEPSMAEAPMAQTRVEERVASVPIPDRVPAQAPAPVSALSEGTLVLPVLPVQPVLVTPDVPRGWKDRLPGRKPLIAAAVASFMLGTGAVTALEVARKGEFPGYHGNVFDPGQSGSHDQPAPRSPSGSGTHEGSTPSQKPDSSPTPSGSQSQAPSSTPSTAPTSDPGATTPTTPGTSATAPATTPSTPPTTQPTGSPDPTATPGTPAPTTPSSAATGAGKATPTGGASG